MDNFELEPGERIWIHEHECDGAYGHYPPSKYTIYHLGKRPQGEISWYCPCPCLNRNFERECHKLEWNVVKEVPPGAVDTLVMWLPDNLEDFFNDNDLKK